MIEIIRDTFTVHSTIGSLFLNGNFICFTLEDVCRPDGVKIKGETAIPKGDYDLIINHSNRFNRLMPLIYNCPDLSVINYSQKWTGIRIHPGNSNADTDGCILVGKEKKTDWVSGSNDAYNELFAILEPLCSNGNSIKLNITNAQTV